MTGHSAKMYGASSIHQLEFGERTDKTAYVWATFVVIKKLNFYLGVSKDLTNYEAP